LPVKPEANVCHSRAVGKQGRSGRQVADIGDAAAVDAERGVAQPTASKKETTKTFESIHRFMAP